MDNTEWNDLNEKDILELLNSLVVNLLPYVYAEDIDERSSVVISMVGEWLVQNPNSNLEEVKRLVIERGPQEFVKKYNIAKPQSYLVFTDLEIGGRDGDRPMIEEMLPAENENSVQGFTELFQESSIYDFFLNHPVVFKRRGIPLQRHLLTAKEKTVLDKQQRGEGLWEPEVQEILPSARNKIARFATYVQARFLSEKDVMSSDPRRILAEFLDEQFYPGYKMVSLAEFFFFAKGSAMREGIGRFDHIDNLVFELRYKKGYTIEVISGLLGKNNYVVSKSLKKIEGASIGGEDGLQVFEELAQLYFIDLNPVQRAYVTARYAGITDNDKLALVTGVDDPLNQVQIRTQIINQISNYPALAGHLSIPMHKEQKKRTLDSKPESNFLVFRGRVEPYVADRVGRILQMGTAEEMLEFYQYEFKGGYDLTPLAANNHEQLRIYLLLNCGLNKDQLDYLYGENKFKLISALKGNLGLDPSDRFLFIEDWVEIYQREPFGIVRGLRDAVKHYINILHPLTNVNIRDEICKSFMYIDKWTGSQLTITPGNEWRELMPAVKRWLAHEFGDSNIFGISEKTNILALRDSFPYLTLAERRLLEKVTVEGSLNPWLEMRQSPWEFYDTNKDRWIKWINRLKSLQSFAVDKSTNQLISVFLDGLHYSNKKYR